MTRREGRGLRLLTLALVGGGLVAPIAAGLAETLAAAFGHVPALGQSGLSLAAFARLVELPGFATSLALSLWTGLAATALSLVLAFALASRIAPVAPSSRIGIVLAPLLAAPHAAMAIGLAFLLAPSGWVARLLSPWATGWQLPPDLATVHDPYGLALVLGLATKEVPFLLLVMLAALGQLPLRGLLATGRALGYRGGQVWLWVVLPGLYPLIRLPLYVVLAYSLSTVDMALLLGPTHPPTLAVAMMRWFLSGDLTLFAPASAAALCLALLTAASIASLALLPRLVAQLARARLAFGLPRQPSLPLALLAIPARVVLGLGVLALIATLLWSITQRWTFPQAFPEALTLDLWLQPSADWGARLAMTAALAGAATVLSLALSILWLEGESRGGYARARWAEALIYLPLLVPQVAFLFGLHVVFLSIGVGGTFGATLWAHVLFTFPYVMLALSEAWRRVDPRLLRTASALGAGPWRRLLAVRLPILTGPLMTAAAIGFAVSVAQFLPTLFMGAGRITTLTTEAVALSSSGDRRIAGLYAALQSALPLAVYGLALALPALLWRDRRGLRGA